MWSIGDARRSREAERHREGPRSCVRVLSGDDELAQALERAIEYEESGTARSQARIDRYQQLVARRSVVVAMAPAGAGGESGQQAETA